MSCFFAVLAGHSCLEPYCFIIRHATCPGATCPVSLPAVLADTVGLPVLTCHVLCRVLVVLTVISVVLLPICKSSRPVTRVSAVLTVISVGCLFIMFYIDTFLRYLVPHSSSCRLSVSSFYLLVPFHKCCVPYPIVLTVISVVSLPTCTVPPVLCTVSYCPDGYRSFNLLKLCRSSHTMSCVPVVPTSPHIL